jgi:hypothetical protein
MASFSPPLPRVLREVKLAIAPYERRIETL